MVRATPGRVARPFVIGSQTQATESARQCRRRDRTRLPDALTRSATFAAARVFPVPDDDPQPPQPERGLPVNLNMTWQWDPGGRGIVARQALVDMVALPTGATGIRIDELVIYRVPRPADEKVLGGITEVDTTRATPGQMPDLSRTVTRPRRVHSITALIDRLPIVQPDFIACPVQLAGVPVVPFRSAPAGPAPRWPASEAANVTEPTGACDALAFSTGVRARPSLLHGARFLDRVDRLVHTRFATTTPIPVG
jgi:hypothetical protein